MAVQLGQAYIAIHADGAALGTEIRAQMEAALAEASAASGAVGAAAGEAGASGVASAAAAADEAAVSMAHLGESAAAAGAEVTSSMAEADAAVHRLATAEAEVAGAAREMGAASAAAGAETAAAATEGAAATGRLAAAQDVASKSASGLGLSLKTMGEFAAGYGIYKAIQAAGDYQQQLTRLVTSANEVQGNLALVSKGMLDMGTSVGFSALDLSKAMYLVESSGQHGAAGLDALKASAEIAKQENADLMTTTQAVTTTLHDYGYTGLSAADAASKLNEAISFGKTNLQDFGSALHSIEPNAAAAKIPLEDILGSLAAMTNSGMSAQQASMNLAHTLQNFEKPSQPMINALSTIGLNSLDLTEQLGQRGLAGTLQEVSDAIIHQMGPSGMVALNALNQNKQAAQALVEEMQTMGDAGLSNVQELSQGLLDGSVSIKDYRTQIREMGGQAGAMGMQFLSLMQSSDGFNQILKGGNPDLQTYIGMMARSTGTVDALRTALQLTGTNTDFVNDAIGHIRDTAAQADGNVAKWTMTQATFNQKFADAKAAVENFGISMGSKVLPILGSFFSWVASTAIPNLQKMWDWFGKLAEGQGVAAAWNTLKTIAGTLLTVIGGLVTAVGTVVGWFGKLPAGVQGAVLAFAALRLLLATDFFGLAQKAAAKFGISTATAGAQAAEASVDVRQLAVAEQEEAAAATEAARTTGLLGTGLSAMKGQVVGATAAARTGMLGFGSSIKSAYTEAAAGPKALAEIQGTGQIFTGTLTGMTAAAGKLATSLGGAVKSAAGGALTMLGGPMGVALLGATVGIQLYSDGVQESTALVQKYTQAGADLAATYQKIGGVMGDQAMAAREQVRNQLDLNLVQDEAGISNGTMTEALKGSTTAQQSAIDSAGSLRNRWLSLNDALDNRHWGALFSGKFLTQNEDDLKGLFSQVDPIAIAMGNFNAEVAKTPGGLQDIYAAAAKVWGPDNVFQLGVTGMGRAMSALQHAGGDVGKQTQALDDLWTHMGETAGGVAVSQVKMTQSLSAVGHAFDDVGDAINANTKDIDLGTVAGANLYTHLQDISKGAHESATAAFEAAGGNSNLAASSKAAGDAMDKNYKQFMSAAEAAGMGADQAAALAGKLGLVPGSVATAILQPGMTEAQAGIATLQKQNGELVGGNPYTVKVQSLTADAEAALNATGYHVQHMPDGTVQITANTGPAESSLSSWLRENSYHEINVGVQTIYEGSDIMVGFQQGARALGGIDIMPFAQGGLIDQTMAQIVPPQTYRLVGDRMSGDEAFIPLDGSPRSKALWSEAGRRMGMAAQGKSISVTYAPQYALPDSASAEQVGAIVGANLVRDFHLGLGDAKLDFG